MSKRKQTPETRKKKKFDGEESSSDEGEEIVQGGKTVQVDFEFFEPQPEVDFHGLKLLLRQLFDADHEYLDLSSLSDLIIAQPWLGSTIKINGKDSGPFAFLTVINLQEHREQPAIENLIEYISKRAGTSPRLENIVKLLEPTSDACVGLLLTERMHGMPTELAPPMYKLLLEEINMALKENEAYPFTHYLLLSKTYVEVESKLDQEDDRPKKKTKASGDALETFFYHPEDECLHRTALAHDSYNLAKQGSDGDADYRRAFHEFAPKPQGHMILIDANQFEATVKALETYVQT